jgi:hypothetical protein
MSSADETSLGTTIRAWRDRLTPAEAGLPARRARRAAGLRREELADLAGVSVDYVVRLEQGRATTRRGRSSARSPARCGCLGRSAITCTGSPACSRRWTA